MLNKTRIGKSLMVMLLELCILICFAHVGCAQKVNNVTEPLTKNTSTMSSSPAPEAVPKQAPAAGATPDAATPVAPAQPLQTTKATEESKPTQEIPQKSAGNTPTDVIKIYEKDVKEVVSKYKGKSDKASIQKKNDEILGKVRQFFDFSELAKLSLGKNWATVNQAQRNEYNEVFKKLIERSYVSKSDKLIGDYAVKYLGEKIIGDKATVDSSVIKQDADVDIKYMMHKKVSGWMIYNVIADTTDLVKNYNSQFNKIINDEGFSGLIKRMRKKLTEDDD